MKDVVQRLLDHPFTRFNTTLVVGPDSLYCFVKPQCQIKNLIPDETALKIAMGAGLTESGAKEAFKASKKKVAEIV